MLAQWIEHKHQCYIPVPLRVLWLIANNCIVRGRKLHVSCLSITSSRELKLVSPLALQDSRPSLIMLHTHQHPPSHLTKLLQQ